MAWPEETPAADFAGKALLVGVGPLVDKDDSPVPAREQAVRAPVLSLLVVGMFVVQVLVQKA